MSPVTKDLMVDRIMIHSSFVKLTAATLPKAYAVAGELENG
jgi:hypothetical protein